MIAFTRKTDYALLALASLAESSAQGEGPVSARYLAERYGVSHPLLMNVLKELVRGEIVQSTRGAKGGYELARSPESISVEEVIVAMEGPPSLTACCGPEGAAATDPADCSVGVHCPITHSVRRLNERMHRFLGEISLADLISDAAEARSGARGVPLSTLKASGQGES